MYKGRDRCRELIEELQLTQALEQEDRDEETEINDQSTQEDHLCEILDSLEGKTVCGTLDFLNKVRLVIFYRNNFLYYLVFICRSW